ncbi:hypothetical protein A1O1_06609 [Capronia coronata CBS 617.96]|uniref:HIT domain-containing protein n=1 Tax=Capronia coronata CBS 617.96 TaxID=1182541 RepID=W9YVD0_9EURO|nr:uncharacterized protein A1O1_06609 [Capronia coronata CBS 617.96]EXJ86239.1 hypothetical protein A1O1_06609 [Capronia coronata CBS 617.96]
MADNPHPSLVPETSHSSATTPGPQSHDYSPQCPFCMISRTYHPISPLVASPRTAVATDNGLEQDPPMALAPDKLDPPSFVLFSSEHVIAFLDIMPLTRGHVLVAPRKHRVKVGDLTPDESGEIGRVLPLLARAVVRAVMPDIPHHQADYNIVQNNGPGAAQVVPHVHFHIVPRPPLNYVPPLPQQSSSSQTQTPRNRKYPPNPPPEGWQRTAILFGRGRRDDLDYHDSAFLVEDMRQCVREEWEATFGETPDVLGNGHRGDRKGAWKV